MAVVRKGTEERSTKPNVVGSSPAGRAIFCALPDGRALSYGEGTFADSGTVSTTRDSPVQGVGFASIAEDAPPRRRA